MLIGSLKTYIELSNTTVFTLPEVPQWENFKTALFTQNILLAFKNTAIIIVVSCVGSIITGTMTAYVVVTNDQLSLLFNADKLLDFLTKLSAVSKNTTLQALNKLASQYDGMMTGLELKK